LNNVKFVPAAKGARTYTRKDFLILRARQTPWWKMRKAEKIGRTVAQLDMDAARQGWVRFSNLPPSERRKYRRATASVN
jgi:hypothetical protein